MASASASPPQKAGEAIHRVSSSTTPTTLIRRSWADTLAFQRSAGIHSTMSHRLSTEEARPKLIRSPDVLLPAFQQNENPDDADDHR